MKKIITLSLVAATLLFTGCGEDTKKEASQTTTKAVESTKEVANTAVDATKKAADQAVEAAKEAAANAKVAADKALEATKEAVDSAKDAVETATADAVDSVIGAVGKEAYAKCAGCHGSDGKTKALGKSPIIAGLDKVELIKMLKEYRAGTRNVAGMGALMKGQVASFDDATLVELATYISSMK